MIKRWSLVLIVCAGLWALWPARESVSPSKGNAAPAAGSPHAAPASNKGVKYTLKFYPGFPYMPGSQPYGLGTPLHGITDVIADFQSRFPDTRIEVVTIPSVREYLVTQLSSGKAPDVIMVTVEDIWPDVQKGWYIPLDAYLEKPNPFVVERGDPTRPGTNQWWDMFKYQAISRGKAAPDGLYYCLTFDMVETGIFYNKALFRKAGVEPPKTWDEFMALLAALKQYREPDGRSVIPLLIPLDNLNAWATDLFFDQLYHGIAPGIDLASDPARGQYMQGYLDWDELAFLHDKGFFTRRDPRYAALWSTMHDVVRYCNRNLQGDCVRDFVTQRGAMFWNISAFAYRLSGDANVDFDWGVFYLPPFTKKTSPYACEQPMCVVGGPATAYAVTNSAIGDTSADKPFQDRIAQSERLKRSIAFLQFLTAPENYARIVNEYPCFMPNITGVETLPMLKPFEDMLQRRYTTTKWIYTFGLKFSEIQRRMIELYLTDGISLDEFLDKWQLPNVDAACAAAKQRKNYDKKKLEQAWQALAPVRVGMEGLPQ